MYNVQFPFLLILINYYHPMWARGFIMHSGFVGEMSGVWVFGCRCLGVDGREGGREICRWLVKEWLVEGW